MNYIAKYNLAMGEIEVFILSIVFTEELFVPNILNEVTFVNGS